MSVFQNMLSLQGVLFLLVLAGIILTKRGIITVAARKSMTDLLIDLVLPANIIASFRVEMTLDLLADSAKLLAFATGIQIVFIFFSFILYRTHPIEKQKVLRYATICSNAGFIGLPVIGGVYGPMGIFYGSIALIPFRVMLWSMGVSIFTADSNRSLKSVAKSVATHPCIIAVYIGIGLWFIPWELPAFLWETIGHVSDCATALPMIVIGGILSEVHIKGIWTKTIAYFASIRLLLLPLVIFLLARLVHLDAMLTGVIVLMVGMPAGSTTAILADKYGCDSEFAAKVVFTSTALSMFTLPVICLLL